MDPCNKNSRAFIFLTLFLRHKNSFFSTQDRHILSPFSVCERESWVFLPSFPRSEYAISITNSPGIMRGGGGRGGGVSIYSSWGPIRGPLSYSVFPSSSSSSFPFSLHSTYVECVLSSLESVPQCLQKKPQNQPSFWTIIAFSHTYNQTWSIWKEK